MRLEIGAVAAVFRGPDGVAGEYRHTDPYKPHIHPLHTPAGHGVTLCSPHDHVHHKALMYALRTRDLNFWEERSTLPGERVGRQRHAAFREVVVDGDEVGFVEDLVWEAADGGNVAFHEVRRIACREDAAQRAFVWSWESALTADRDLELVQSQWSHTLPDGNRVNYHGLGIRLRRDFGGGTRNNRLTVDGEVLTDADFVDWMGLTPRSVEFVGSIDGIWPVPRAGVRFETGAGHGLYVLSDYFPFMALGPTNLGPRAVRAGEVLLEAFRITVFDLPDGSV